MKYQNLCPNSEIEEVFNGQELYSVIFKSVFTVGDSVKLKTNHPKNRIGVNYKTYDTNTVYNITKMEINVYDGKAETICDLLSESKNQYGFNDYIRDVQSTELEIIEGHEFEYTLTTPFKPNDNAWLFLNHLYDIYTPNYELVIGHGLHVLMSIGEQKIISICPVVITKEWSVKNLQGRGSVEDFYYIRTHNLTKIRYNNNRKIVGNEPLLYTTNMFENDVDFDTFAVTTYKNDAFRDNCFSESNYRIFAQQKGKTLEDLKIASQKQIKPKIKNQTNKPKSKAKTNGNDDLEDIIADLTPKEIKTLKKLLKKLYKRGWI